MTIQTYTIELKVDAGPEQHAAMTEAMKQLARDFLTVAMLLSPGRAPLIACRTEDAFYDTQEIELLPPND